ncbi:LysR substrate-binding domain-containing protein [Pseudomonas sp.]|uniref:LysR substrate-binding domain-containing protein n=2 Tax=Pseudomonas TaxID=286 RepID=UPI0019D9C3D0|nr:LysR substrate-binding domain-containing protein [Pseudomonas sp.]MBF0673789.1 LysR family transcriptional regulator [Pseudomonas sp.]
MNDLNDLHYFAITVRHGGFSAASRATGIEKSRLSRRVAALEKRLGVRLMHRTTRTLVLTDAGERFYVQCQAALESVNNAYESLAELQREPSGIVRVSCPLVVAQSYLAPILPGFMSTHPKVAVVIDASDRVVNVVEERFDIALQATTRIDESLGLVSRLLGQAYPILVASPNYLQRHGRPDSINDLNDFATICTLADFAHEQGRWGLMRDQAEPLLIHHTPTLITDDLRVQLEATVHGTGIALLPEPLVSASIHEGLLERILPSWVGTPTGLSLTYPSPRGILPAVRSLIDYLSLHIPTAIQQRVIYAEAGRGLTECGSA